MVLHPQGLRKTLLKFWRWYDWLTIGGELRLRPEFYARFYPFVPVRTGSSRDAFVLIRARLNFDARPVNHLRVFVQPQFARSVADSESTIANVNYTFPVRLKPMLAGEFSYASGDSTPGTGTVKTFNQLFTFHGKHGNMDLVGWQNIYDAKGHVSIRSSDATKVQLEYHAFWLPEPADGLYAASGAQLRAGAAGAGYSFFKSGAFLKNTGASSIAHWGYVQATARF